MNDGGGSARRRRILLYGVGMFALGALVALAPVGWFLHTDRLFMSLAPRMALNPPEVTGPLPSGLITGRYPVLIEKFPVEADEIGRGGALASAGDLTLYVSRRGVFHRLTERGFEPLAVPAPFDWERLRENAPDPATALALGTRDVLLRSQGNGFEVFVSYLALDEEAGCLRMHAARAMLGRLDAASIEAPPVRWERLYASEPCLQLGIRMDPATGAAGTLALSGGRLLLAVGDFGLNGVYGMKFGRAPQDPGLPFGKIMEVPVGGGEPEVLTLGHRNVSGLAETPDGRLWGVEHGPRGGDELNEIRVGANYGWPGVTEGSRYGSFEWPLDLEAASETVPPVFAWVPSIAPSSMIVLSGAMFPDWEGDLLVATLRAGRLLRLRLGASRVLYIEPLVLGTRVRDLAQTRDGEILALLDTQPWVLRLSIGGDGTAAPRGLTFCVACHQISDEAGDNTGPSLVGVWGRPIAGLPDYPYSEALRAVEGVWDTRTLRAYLSDPQEFAPGTTMPRVEVSNTLSSTIRHLRQARESSGN